MIYAHDLAPGVYREVTIADRSSNLDGRKTICAEQKIMSPSVSVVVISRDLSLRVDPGEGADKSRNPTWDIKRSDPPALSR